MTLRLGSAAAGTLAIPVGAALARRIGGNPAGILTAALCALAPSLYLSSRDARMYALATTLVMASCLALWRALEAPSGRRWALYGGLTALAFYTQYWTALAVIAQLIALGVLRAGWRRLLSAAASVALAGLTLVPWLIAATGQFRHAGAPFWIPPDSFVWVSGALVQFFSGQPLGPQVPAKPLLLVLQGVAVAAGVGASLALISWRHRLAAPGRRVAAFCALCGLGGLGLLFVVSLDRPVFQGSYASVLWGPLFPLVGTGLALIPARSLAAVGLLPFAVASAAISITPTHPDSASAVAALRREVRPGDLVDAHPSQYLLLLYYGDEQLAAQMRVVGRDIGWYWGIAAYPPGAIVPQVPAAVIAAGGAIYYAYEPGDTGFSPPGGYALRTTQCWAGVCIETYRR
jgi:4-amino-4-deoxy-L-arabinose transferase-like glycosyltransferase